MPAHTEPESLGLSASRLARLGGWMDGYVESGKLPGCLTAVMRRGALVYFECRGMADPETSRAVAPDTVFRIYSMSKPIVTAAAMTLFEEGCFQLDDPVSRILPEFADTPVWVSGAGGAMKTEPPAQAMKIWHLMSHTSGLVYGGRSEGPVGDAYLKAKINFGQRNDATLAEMVRAVASLPLNAHPGAAWEYGVSTDVLGRLIEAVADQPLDQILQQRIFDPLGMTDTGFQVRPNQLSRLAALFSARDGGIVLEERPDENASYVRPVTLFSGGGGLVSTAGDYLRFAEAVRRKGELDGARILGRRTVELMTMNHLPGNVDLTAMGQPTFSETSMDGIGFGLGFSIVLDPATTKAACSVGEHAWGGVASTAFWIDPVEDIVAVFMTQVLPSSTYPIRRELRALVYQALVD
jgi:CubicO group peptidase (beta-lactamase class C family)